MATNQALEQRAGVGPLAGRWASVVFPRLKNQISEHLGLCRTVVNTGRPQRFELWVNDSTQCLSTSLFPAGPDRILVLIEEITSKKATEESLLESRKLLSKISRQVPGMTFQLYRSAKGRFSFPFVGSGVDSILEISSEGLMRNPAWIFRRIHPEDVRPVFHQVLDAIDSHDPFHAEFRVVLAERGLRWLRCDAVPERLEDGTTLWHGVFADITEEKEAKLALEESKRFLENIINTVADPIFVKDRPGGPLLLFNDAFCHLAGVTRNELTANGGMVDFPESEHRFFTQIDEQVFATGIENIVEEPLTDSKGTLHTVVTKKTLYTDERNRKYLVGAVQDVTERLKSEELLLRSEKLESLGVLAGGIGHDFNNLLAGLFAYLELAKGKVTTGDTEKALHYLSKTLSVFQRAKAMTQQLLTFAKGGVPLFQSHDLRHVIRAAADSALGDGRLTCEFDIAEDLWSCDCDVGQISQVIDNLVTNAIRAMPEGGTIFIRSENVESPQGPFIKITVRDQGVGIPQEDLPRIFDPFFSTKKDGHGLGLATVHSVVLKHGGMVDVESEQGQGTAFHVFLPASPVLEPFESLPGKLPHEGSGRILLMDDEDMLREATQDMLESLGYSVTATSDGTQALLRYQEARETANPFVAAILDLTIPRGTGGKEVARVLREEYPDAILIAASGYSDDPIMADPKAYSFTDRIVKPFLKRDLEELLDRVFDPRG